MGQWKAQFNTNQSHNGGVNLENVLVLPILYRKAFTDFLWSIMSLMVAGPGLQITVLSWWVEVWPYTVQAHTLHLRPSQTLQTLPSWTHNHITEPVLWMGSFYMRCHFTLLPLSVPNSQCIKTSWDNDVLADVCQ